MHIPLYQVDAFTEEPFKGNPAAVCPLNDWLPDELMQHIAMENNLSETAFFVSGKHGYDLRWFTPLHEVDLCGHATLAAAHVLFRHLDYRDQQILFNTASGKLNVSRGKENLLEMDFPAHIPAEVINDPLYGKIFGYHPQAAFKAKYLMLVYPDERTVRSVSPDPAMVKNLDDVGVVITSPGDKYDFVSRFFAPAVGIDEDPVTGSTHSTLIPYWSRRLGKNEMKAYQCSPRGGILYCGNAGERVIIGGRAITFMEGQIVL